MKRQYLVKICTVLLVGICLAADALLQQRQTILTITSEPGATVWVDGVRFGKTDAAGKFTIKDLGGRATPSWSALTD